MMQHREVTLYIGKYKGITYEIAKSGHWTYYLFINEQQIPDAFEMFWLPGEKFSLGGPDRIIYRYDKSEIITSLDWHGGCTYYDKVSGFDGATRMVKIGCDYQHLFDEGRSYRLQDIERDVQDCIESLLRQVTVLQRCSYCGRYFAEVNARGWCAGCQEEHGKENA